MLVKQFHSVVATRDVCRSQPLLFLLLSHVYFYREHLFDSVNLQPCRACVGAVCEELRLGLPISSYPVGVCVLALLVLSIVLAPRFVTFLVQVTARCTQQNLDVAQNKDL